MRLTLAFVALSLVGTTSALSSESNRSRRNSDVRAKTSHSSSISTATAEDMMARKRKSPGAPLVDSTLLRFVSTQKKQQKRRLKELDSNRRSKTSAETSASVLENDIAAGASTIPSPIDSNDVRMDAFRGEDLLDPWMGQFNRNRIAQKLVAIGADETLALEAGEKLQSYVLIRTARRRIRMFLKERDSLWNSNNGTSDALMKTIIPGSELKSPSYGFDDVLDVFVESGFTGTDVCAILTHTPSLALMMPRKSFANEAGTTNEDKRIAVLSGETLEQTIERSFSGLLLGTLGMRKYDARKVMRSCPGLLSVRGSKSAVEVVAMMTQLGVSTNSIARDKASLPTLLSRSPAGLFRLISFLSSDGVRMPIRSIGPLIRRSASRDLLDTIVPVPQMQVLSKKNVERDSGVGPDLESAIWGKTREERTKKINEVYRNMTKTVWTLRNEIGTKDLGKIIASYPSVLLLDAELKILPTASYLMDDLGIMKGDLASVLQLYPVLLGKDIEEFETIKEYLVSLGVKEDDLSSIFRAFPALLTMDIEETMMPVVEYLQSIGITNLGSFITSLPPILGYSVEKELKPKWEYLNKVCLQAKFELVKFPAYFSYPFDRVIKTRYDYLAAKEIPRQLLPVDAVLRHGDVEFATKVARDVDEGKVFRIFSENRMRAQSGRNRRRKEKSPKRQAKSRPKTNTQ